ncbi:MAG TPA: 50S ribosomal protein L21 [Deltaproteobacteria bacterium]|jgi:large subunit ribosomal protein L21|nr:50S ribosomal protein L21 [Deltaproteobacteria bacterium]OQC27473.1 MAG: 50S ribosomal protein L21 [Deltaproteobacteria bacterium ADurb.Bin072]HRW81210.1 50S ribosomal protein L21 [Desulfomonilia bacterium]HNQ85205.1 50S ribosomal protein L21 [Deltaproteobacteria bacterium]HNS90430.1 50S ribosomal protein L21 [Deltaproteobacteria bacterium]
MYAVIKTGGKQYKVEEGDIVRVEKIEAEKGDAVTFDNVLLIGGDEYAIGTPTVKGASVSASVVRQFRDKKIVVFKMKRRKRYRKTQGHRQYLTEVRITKISKD